MIDPTALLHPGAKIGPGVAIGPYSIVGEGVEIGEGSHIGPHVVLKGPTRIGRNNRIFQFCSIGEDPQDKKFHGEPESFLDIGDSNTIREYCSINRGTHGGGGITRIGDENWIMAYVHIAHDCIIGNDNVFANNATLAGHVGIQDHVILGGFTGIHQFCTIGSYSFTAISSVVVKDVPPYIIVSGNTAKAKGLNREGLRRHGFSQELVEQLRTAYKTIFRNGLIISESMEKLRDLSEACPEVAAFCSFIRESSRGIVR